MKDYALLSLALEGAYQQAYACVRLDIGLAHHIRKGFAYNGTWNDGLVVMQTGLLVAGGPMIQLGNKLVLTPHVGIGFLDFSPPEDERNKEGNDVSLTFATVGVGVNFDIPLMADNRETFFRLNIGHRRALTSLSFAAGGYTFVTLGLEYFRRPEVREEYMRVKKDEGRVDVAPVFRTPRKGGILRKEVSAWQHVDDGTTNSSSLMHCA